MKNKLQLFAKGVKNDTANKWDVVAAFTGPEGVGKTTLMITAGSYIDDAFTKDWFNALDTNISYMPKHSEVVEKFNALKPGSVYIIDEAIKVLDCD